jgi:uncharacterized protein (TIGR00369 family)
MTEDSLARWRAEEQAVRARLAAPGYVRAEQVRGRTGLETLDFVPIRIEPGVAVFQGRPQRRHYNPLGSVHGGWFATLLDSALGCAVHSALPAAKGYTTLELKVNIVRALTDAVPLVRAEGKLIHFGRQMATSEARLIGPDGKLYAHGTTTCLVLEQP